MTMKGLKKICSECGMKTELQAISLEVERHGIKATMTGVPAMVCPRCGEQYIPGEVAGKIIDLLHNILDQTESAFHQAYTWTDPALASPQFKGQLILALA